MQLGGCRLEVVVQLFYRQCQVGVNINLAEIAERLGAMVSDGVGRKFPFAD